MTQSYNAVMKAWGRTKLANSADRCEYWLRKMIDANRGGGGDDGDPRRGGDRNNFVPKPNVQTYNLVMDGHINLGDAARVQDMLLEMDATDGDVTPNSESFSKVIRAWLSDELREKQYGLPGACVRC